MNTAEDLFDVLIAGAGPTGLTAAVALAEAGRRIAIVDAHPASAPTSRAAVVHARTLEVLDRLGVAQRLLEVGLVRHVFVFRTRARPLVTLDFTALPGRFACVLFVSQFRTEEVLRGRLAELGVEVIRPAAVLAVRALPERVDVELDDGRVLSGSYLIGADGMNSTVRSQAGIGFSIPGRRGREGTSFVLADVELEGGGTGNAGSAPSEASLSAGPEGLLVSVPLPGGQWRIVAETAEVPETPGRDYLQRLLDTRGAAEEPGTIRSVAWSSRFRIHSRLADTFLAGRILLAGDAAHVHSPAGGQGMNLGIRDAAAAATALDRVLAGAPGSVLAAWAGQRRSRALQVIRLTRRIAGVALVPGPLRPLRDALLLAGGSVPAVRKRIASSLAGLADR
ncbi:MAG: FAD-dependent oxidoreductase [Actinomycetales bacterium]